MNASKYHFPLLLLILLQGLSGLSKGDDFYRIQTLEILTVEPTKGRYVMIPESVVDPKTGVKKRMRVFKPCIEIQLLAKDNFRTNTLVLKAHFYDSTKRLIASADPSRDILQEDHRYYAMNPLVKGGQRESIFFQIPSAILSLKEWSVLVVAGDKYGASAKVSGTSPVNDYEFPEIGLLALSGIERNIIRSKIDPVVQEVVTTNNPDQPQLTVLMRPPLGIADSSEIKGVVALCLLADNVEQIRQFLLGKDPGWKLSYALKFADDNKLAVIAWGSRRAWGIKGSYFNFNQKESKEINKLCDELADAWEVAVRRFVNKYGIQQKDYLIWSMSAAANWGHRLVLRKPQYFGAAHIEISSSYDRPTPQASKVMWLLTTGELEIGYEDSKHFYSDCRKLGYPIIYKAEPFVAHHNTENAEDLGLEFFRFALAQIENGKLAVVTNSKEDRATLELSKRLEPFYSPKFYGDIVNQNVESASTAASIPLGYQTPLPTEKLAELWKE